MKLYLNFSQISSCIKAYFAETDIIIGAEFSQINSCVPTYLAETGAIIKPDLGVITTVSSPGIPKGGTVGDILVKIADGDYEAAWASPEDVCPKEIFWAEYGVTPYNEINEAYVAGKTIIVTYQSYITQLSNYWSNTETYLFSVFVDGYNYELFCAPGIDIEHQWAHNIIEYAPSIAAVPSGGAQGQVLVKASGNDYDVTWGEGGGGGNANVLIDTTANWNSQIGLVGQRGTIYVYSDYMAVQNANIPGVKIGDGQAYLIDTPFVEGGNVALAQHIANNTIHVTAAEKAFWNNKVTCFLAQSSAETLVFSKD